MTRLWVAIRIGRQNSGEEGIVLVTAVVLLTVIVMLSILVVMSAEHANIAATRGRNDEMALALADAGINEAIAKIDVLGFDAVGDLSGSTDAGSYEVTITSDSPSTWTIDSIGSVAAFPGIHSDRHVRVTLEAPIVFRDAFWAVGSIDTKNNDNITGDVYSAQGNILIDVNTTVTGNVAAAIGWIKTNGPVSGDVWSGGTDGSDAIRIGGTVGGDVSASVASPGCAVAAGPYRVTVSSIITGNLTTWGTLSGTPPLGTTSNNTCTEALTPETIPDFSYDAVNYDPSTIHNFGTPTLSSATAQADFQAYLTANAASFEGVFTIFQSGALGQANRIDLSGAELSGPITIVTNLPIYGGTLDDSPAGSGGIVVLFSSYDPPGATVCDVNDDNSECSIHFKNGLDVPIDYPVLMYAPFGPVAIKNNSTGYGAVYSESIFVKNNQTWVYDGRVDRIIGFGEATLVINSWLEIPVHS